MQFNYPTWNPNWGPTSYPIPQFGQYNQAMPTIPQQAQAVQQTPQNAGGINWCQGLEGAKAFAVEPGKSAFIMDSEGQHFYIKSVDNSGIPAPLRVFDYTERQAPAPQSAAAAPAFNPSDYVPRKEFDDLVAKVGTLANEWEGLTNG